MSDFPLDFIVLDAETDGLRPSVIHMLGVQNLLSGEYRSFVGLEEVATCVFRIQEETLMMVGHNINGYDRSVIKNLTTVEIPKTIIVDTLDMSRDLCKLKNHKLENWGEIIGLPKLKAPLFEHYTPEMDTYCERDVRLNTAVFGFLLRLYQGANRDAMTFNTTPLHDYADILARSIVA